MSFYAIEAAAGRNGHELGVSIKRSPGHPSRLRVSLRQDIARRLGWEPGVKILPLAGDGPDAGQVKLTITDRNGFKVTVPPGSTNRMQVVFRAPAGSPESLAMTAANFHISTLDRSLTIRLPWHTRNGLRAAE